MQIGMLIIGSELLQGKQREANLHFLGEFLRTYHREVSFVQIVADKKNHILEALESLYKNCSLVIVCGGLGPTPDDATKEVLAEYFKKEISYSDLAHKIAQDNYQRMNKPYPDHHTYSLLPQAFEALANPVGFAPGLWFSHEKKSLMALPGVPREFQTMLKEHLPKRTSLESAEKFNLVTVRTKGIPEEKIFQELCPSLWKDLEVYGDVSSLPQLMGVDVGLKTLAPPQVIYDFIASTPLAPYVWSYGVKTLEEKIIELAQSKKITIGFAESCTGGLCAHRLTNTSGASKVFFGSVVCYDNSLKEKLLKVQPKTLESFGAVSEECAREMAQGALKTLDVDIALSLTGIAGPLGGSVEKPVGTVWIGIALRDKVSAKKFQFKGDRENLKLRFSQAALFLLRDELTI